MGSERFVSAMEMGPYLGLISDCFFMWVCTQYPWVPAIKGLSASCSASLRNDKQKGKDKDNCDSNDKADSFASLRNDKQKGNGSRRKVPGCDVILM